jgi:hypothetical protein
MASGARLYTRALTTGQSLVITNSGALAGCLSISYLMSGTSGDNGTLTGDYNLDPGTTLYQSQAITIPAGSGNTLVTTPNKPWTGVTITCNTGTLYVQLAF